MSLNRGYAPDRPVYALSTRGTWHTLVEVLGPAIWAKAAGRELVLAACGQAVIVVAGGGTADPERVLAGGRTCPRCDPYPLAYNQIHGSGAYVEWVRLHAIECEVAHNAYGYGDRPRTPARALTVRPKVTAIYGPRSGTYRIVAPDTGTGMAIADAIAFGTEAQLRSLLERTESTVER